MKFKAIILTFLVLQVFVVAGGVKLDEAYHPKSEPNGQFMEARKAYKEDRVRYGSRLIIRKVFDYVCG